MTENPTSRFEPARNTFEAWNVNFYESKARTTNAWALAYALLGFWNMNGRGRCNPSLATLLAKTRIKSHNTLLKAIQELEEIGEWAVVRSKGRSSHYYYPLFVKNARTDLVSGGLSDLEIAKMELDEQEYAHENLDPQDQNGFTSYDEQGLDPYPQEDPSPQENDQDYAFIQEATAQGDNFHNCDASQGSHLATSQSEEKASMPVKALSLITNTKTPDVVSATGIKSIPTLNGLEVKDVSVRVKTPEDLEIKTSYDALMLEQIIPDNRRTVDSRFCQRKLVLHPGEIKDLNIAFDRFDPEGSNRNKYLVAGGQGFLFPEELGPRWVEEFTMNYGPQVFSYSSINEIYSTFLAEFIDRTDWDKQMHLVDAAMYVLGNDAFVPSVATVKALLFGTRHNTKMAMLKEQVEETIIGRKLTGEYIIRGLYTEKGSW